MANCSTVDSWIGCWRYFQVKVGRPLKKGEYGDDGGALLKDSAET